MPKPPARLFVPTAVAVILSVSACGGSNPAAYPTVTVLQPKFGPPITSPNGSVVQYPARPVTHVVRPSASCEWVLYKSNPSQAPAALSPPAPGLTAQRLSPRRVRLKYSFVALPDDCRPSYVTLGVVASHSNDAMPNTKEVAIHSLSGTAILTYSSFLHPPDVALASANTPVGARSRVVKVLIAGRA